MKRRCPQCGRMVKVREDGTFYRHSPTWVYPPPGAPMCSTGKSLLRGDA